LDTLELLRPKPPEEVIKILNRPENKIAMDRGLGEGAAVIAQKLTVNIGVLQGGVQVNMLPGLCAFEADMRIPIGLKIEDVLVEVNTLLRSYPEVSMEYPPRTRLDASWSNPEHEMVKILQENVEQLLGFRPTAVVSLGSTDCRFWRSKGTPAYVYGPTPEGMGKPNESVSVNEFLHVLRTHVLSACDYLS
jgi:succinyl-diaminopimelate desuccinylase